MIQKYICTDLNFQSYYKQEQSQFRIKEQGEIAWYESFHRGKIKIQIKKYAELYLQRCRIRIPIKF